MNKEKMTKFKWFNSFYSERDWLEEMATQGWLLEDLVLGVFYHFKKSEPCEKVYEVERFAVTQHPTISEVTARTNALDITSQFGWEQLAHDEDMNYYFMKDKAGDETDEFYDDPDMRRERAERYRKYYAIESPMVIIVIMLVFSLSLLGLHWITQTSDFALVITLNILSLLLAYYFILRGQRIYYEFCMSREEWTRYKQLSEKKRFRQVQQLCSYLQEKNELGLSLAGHENGRFLFEKDPGRYNYFVDTKRCLKKRLKENTAQLGDEKDLLKVSLNWFEQSMANAAKFGLSPVAVIGKDVLIYKRPYSDAPLPWENGTERISHSIWAIFLRMASLLLICYVLGYIVGYGLGHFL